MTIFPPPQKRMVSAGWSNEEVLRCDFVLEIRFDMGKRQLLPPSPWQRLLVFDLCGISRSRLKRRGLPVR